MSYPVFCLALFIIQGLHFSWRQFSFFFILEMMTHVSLNDACGRSGLFSADAADKHHMTLQNQWFMVLNSLTKTCNFSSFQSQSVSCVWLNVLPPHSPAANMILYSLEALPGVAQPTSRPAHQTPRSLSLWVTWLTERSVHLPHLLVHLGDPQPETDKIG